MNIKTKRQYIFFICIEQYFRRKIFASYGLPTTSFVNFIQAYLWKKPLKKYVQVMNAVSKSNNNQRRCDQREYVHSIDCQIKAHISIETSSLCIRQCSTNSSHLAIIFHKKITCHHIPYLIPLHCKMTNAMHKEKKTIPF